MATDLSLATMRGTFGRRVSSGRQEASGRAVLCSRPEHMAVCKSRERDMNELGMCVGGGIIEVTDASEVSVQGKEKNQRRSVARCCCC